MTPHRTISMLTRLRLALVVPLLASLLPAQTYDFSTWIGLAGTSGSADGTGTAARLSFPGGAALDGAGNFYVMSSGALRKVSPAGVVTTVATGFQWSAGVVVESDGSAYVLESSNHVVRKVSVAGIVSNFAGSTGASGSADGTGSAARLYQPEGIAIDGSGNL